MSKLKKYSLHILFLLCIATPVTAQYYSWGGDPVNVRWKKIKTADTKLVYPEYFEENARRMLWYLDTIRPHISHGYRLGTMRTPVVLHTQNMSGNGMVMWAPKRIEMLGAPSASYSEPWLKQLVFHEYRHNVQYNNLNRGVNRVLTWFLGEQIAFLGIVQFSMFALEGDAVMTETELSAFGRGLQPSFTMHYRAVGDVGSKKYAGDYWFTGSYRDYVPDHYALGYQMVRWSYNRWNKNIWDDVARYVARNPEFIVPSYISLNKFYKTSSTKLFRGAFADLNAHWDSLPRTENSSRRGRTVETSYTSYKWPLWLNDSTLVAFKRDFDRPNRIVQVDARTGHEKTLAHTGAVSSRPVLAEGKLWWTEYRNSLLWAEKRNSQLCSYDFATDRKRVHRSREQKLYPTHTPSGFAWVEYDYTGQFSIVEGERRLDFPRNIEIKGLAWDDTTARLYFIGLDDGGMFLAAVEGSPDSDSSDGSDAGYSRLTPARHITISDLRASGGRLYFGSIVSGKDEAHCYDIASGVEYRLSQSEFGSFQPSLSPDGSRIALTTYDRHGYHLATQRAAERRVQEQRELPVDLVNPKWKRWEGTPKMDSLVYTPAEEARSKAAHKPRRYLKMFKIFRPHSWLPLNFYPPAAIQESEISVSLGATVMSQNLLSDAVSWLSYGWSRRGSHLVRGGLSYSGLGPVLAVDFQWGGGAQVRYTEIPADVQLKRYFSVSTSVSLPMSVSSGYWTSTLTPRAEFFYTNGLIFQPDPAGGTGTLTRGVERLYAGATYTGQVRITEKEFLPRWGVAVRAGYVMNPTNRRFHDLYSVFVRGYLPGIVRPHSLMVRAAWQQSIASDRAIYGFQMKELVPRGVVYNISPRRWAAASLDYQLPVWYPEGGIPMVLYFKRIRVNLFTDFARWQDFSGGIAAVNGAAANTGPNGGRWHSLYSYGLDLILDITPFRLPSSANVSLKFTLAKPSDRRGVWFGFGLDMPI